MKKWLGIGLGSLVFLAIAGLIGFWIWINAFLASPEFRTRVERQLAAALQADCTVMPLKWSGFSVYSTGLEARGTNRSAFTSLIASEIRAELNFRALLARRWEIPSIDIQHVVVEFDAATPRQEPQPLPPLPSPAGSGKLASLLPNQVTIKTINIQSMDMNWKRNINATPITARGVSVVLTQDGASWRVDAAQGKIAPGYGPELTLNQARLRLRWPELFISFVELRPEGKGTLKLSGETAFEPVSKMDLLVEMAGLPVDPYLPQDWRARLVGDLFGSLRITGEPSHPSTLQGIGPIELREGRLEALPALEKVATLTKTREFHSLRLHRANAHLRWTPSRTTLEKIILESESILRIEGEVSWEESRLFGILELGTTPAVLRALPGTQEKIFSISRDGYIWAQPHVTLSGTTDQPVEDLSPRVLSAVVEGVKDEVVDTVKGLWQKAKDLIPLP
jgi:hypothetical protein